MWALGRSALARQAGGWGGGGEGCALKQKRLGITALDEPDEGRGNADAEASQIHRLTNCHLLLFRQWLREVRRELAV